MMRLIRCFSLLGFMALVSGCTTLDLMSCGASGISYLVSGKSLSDHLISAIKQEDCAMHRALKGEQTCIPLTPPNEMVARVETKESYTTDPLQTISLSDNNDYTPAQLVATNIKPSAGKTPLLTVAGFNTANSPQ